MKRTVSFAALSVCIALLVALTGGCEANKGCAAKEGLLLDHASEGKVHIAWSDVYESDGGAVVSGVLKRNDTIGLPIKAHVQVSILSPDGQVIDAGRSEDVLVPRQIATKVQRLSRFRVPLANMPPKGSTVRLVVGS
jgi:hypothetical protein